MRKMKKMLYELDKKKRSTKCLEKAPLIVEVAERVGWSRLWDAALDLGWKTVKGLQMVSRAMSHHGRGNHPCYLCDVAPLSEASVLEHILVNHSEQLHLDLELDCEALLSMLENLHLDVVSKFRNVFLCY